MADEQSDLPAEDTTPVVEPVEAEADDTDLEDIEVSEEELDEPEESEEAEETPAKEEESDDSEPEEQESEGEDTPPEETSEEEQKRFNDEQAKRRIAEKKLREEREANEQANLQRYLEEADGDDAELQKRQIEVQQFNVLKQQASVNQDKLEVGVQRAVAANQDLFKTGSPEVKEELAKALDDFVALHVVQDKYGNPLEVKADVYQYLNDKANSIRRLTGIGARQQTKQKANERMRTVPRPTRTPKEPTVDKDVQDFDDAFNE